jgi:hypothetical protein
MGASLLADANVLGARIALGCSLREPTIASVSAAIGRNFSKASESERQRVEQMLLYRPVVLSPRLDRNVTARLATGTSDELLKAARAIAFGDAVSARTALLRVDRRVDPGVPTPDITLARAQLWLQVGDSTKAIRVLDTTLSAVRSYDPGVLADPVNAGALVRAMLLRAKLAAQRSDAATARQWRAAVESLWSSADPDLALEVPIRTR